MKSYLIFAAWILMVSNACFAKSTDWSARLLSNMKCACDVAGERVFYDDKTLGECDCPQGKSMQQRIKAYMDIQAGPDGRRAALEFLETLTDEDPANERYAIYDQATHAELMKNTMCTCGCGKMALSQCPLDCPWSPTYQARFKWLLVLGYTADQAIAHYLKDANRAHRKGDNLLTKEQIMLNQETPLSWGIPIAVGVFSVLLFVSIMMMRARVQNRAAAAAAGAMPSPQLTELDRELLQDELDDIGG